MPESPQILSGLHEIAGEYDMLICDVWGVLHNGAHAHEPACEALRRFRDDRGPVILLSNAPRPVADLEKQFSKFGVPTDCYDAIVTSGGAARDELARRREKAGELRMFHLGPERDRGVFDGLDIFCVDPEEAEIALCTGLYNDDVETPDDYTDILQGLKDSRLEMICANPDLVVQRGGVLVYCAGALAKAYEAMGGTAIYYGKPYRPIYDSVLALAPEARRPLAIGDGLVTDIRGANAAGFDALFIADGIHGDDVEPYTAEHLRALFGTEGVDARAAMRSLAW